MELLQKTIKKISIVIIGSYAMWFVINFFKLGFDSKILESISDVLMIIFILSLSLRIIVDIVLSVLEKRWITLILYTLAITCISTLLITSFPMLKDSTNRSRISYGTSRIYYEFTQNEIGYTNLPDSLLKNISIETVLKNFSIIELKNDSGYSALFFKPLENASVNYGVCIDNSGDIHSYIRDEISTYEECLENPVHGTIYTQLGDD